MLWEDICLPEDMMLNVDDEQQIVIVRTNTETAVTKVIALSFERPVFGDERSIGGHIIT
jgi:hypothetical protein